MSPCTVILPLRVSGDAASDNECSETQSYILLAAVLWDAVSYAISSLCRALGAPAVEESDTYHSGRNTSPLSSIKAVWMQWYELSLVVASPLWRWGWVSFLACENRMGGSYMMAVACGHHEMCGRYLYLRELTKQMLSIRIHIKLAIAWLLVKLVT